jgi:arginyl-tRNA synthetase
MIKPIPLNIGVGVSSFEEHPEYVTLGYKPENVGRYWNYHFTVRNWKYPTEPKMDHPYTIDGFSPNLNKELHIGHLRNLIVATSLSRLFPKAKMVAMLGAAVGVEPYAMGMLDEFYQRAGYLPDLYYDNKLPDNVETVDGEGEQAGCKVWIGPKGPIIVTRSDGRHTYAHHDLCFANLVGPTHYVTGAEQKEHFESLGFGHKHLAMGLVLGADGKKISSRNGGAMSLREAVLSVADALQEYKSGYNPDTMDLAWNVVAWNMLKNSRAKNVLFNPEQWTKIDSPGMYITYTYARVDSALSNIEGDESQITEQDVKLLGACSYLNYYIERAQDQMDASPIANFTLDLAKEITSAYHAEKIQGGRPGYQFAMLHAHHTLGKCMDLLGMKLLTRV